MVPLLPGSNNAMITFAPASGADAMRRPIPPQAPAHEGLAQLRDVQLWYSDTGGNGPAVVFSHPRTGSGLIWAYQQPVFAGAGYRVISYSRRGYYGSDAGPKDNPGTGADDLRDLMDVLKVDKFHAIGLAAGGIVTMDFALSCPERLYSLTEACTIMGIEDESYLAISKRLRPKGFGDMPPSFRELGPSYRATNPEGVEAWIALEHKAIQATVAQRNNNKITLQALKTMKIPTLLIAGDADPFAPPAVLRIYAEHLPNNEAVVIPESGHSVYWEQPDAFNRTVLGFMQTRLESAGLNTRS
jgi:pimeloyl-ACP methyl ester carboxylesterase